MALPREVILQGLKTRLEGITAGGGSNYTVRTVDIGAELPTRRNRSEYPLILIVPDGKEDADDRETQGNQSANTYHRWWPMEIRGLFYPSSTADLRVEGEKLLTDIVKRLVTSKTFGLSPASFSMGFILQSMFSPNAFEADQSGLVWVGVDITVTYSFRADAI